ncbi:DNA translocase FtsK [Mesorhizobium sp. B2-5-13]|uniref:DNA translocase FtsK n=1 Tax=unclassified Mesorhizobium TaxID=325217 RepID=UPI001128CD81|nr:MULTISPECIES: DNA translocase FtsK [unclassified Mesorhizobium]TPJ38111.1 DNA translocase FtsK [Mesorhizobium sp. B2-6-5]TPJ84144.1 DNA translocase FtsK [Mesorhizobium sp. B2-5-13]TPK46689.1 DNA translocase FtsK [Mesorhizobium sp. B2-5-5]
MEARRFSRVNSLHTASPDDPERERSGGPHGKVDVRQSGASHAGQSGRVADPGDDRRPSVGPNGKPAADNAFPQGYTESPAWQEYFFLAPNVRFTRTPDYEPKHRQPHDEVAAQGDPQAPPTQQVGPGAVMHRGPSPAASAQPARGGETSQGVQPTAPKMPATARAATRPAPVVVNGAPVRTATAEKARRPYLSDHAFFEGLAPLLVDVTSPPRSVSPVSRVPVAAAPVAAARADISASAVADVTTLFRVIECLPGQASSALPDVFPANSNKALVEPSVPAGRAVRQGRTTAVVASAASSAAPLVQRVEETVATVRGPSLPMAGKVARPVTGESYEVPSKELLQQPPEGQGFYMSQERLEQNADLLESVLEDFGVRGEIIHVRPGPVVTLYEFEPAPGVKSSRVIGLADDIARSMSAVSARVAVVPGRNVIGIELPNETRETVYFRELIESQGFRKTSCKLALCLGKTIGGEPVIAELAKMPHLLVAGTTGSGKSVAINTMILSLLYRLKPEECRLIMVDPKMLELSVYDGIPHLLTPVVTDPKKAVTALKWAVREMEDRYRKMARLGVRNIDGYNERAAQVRDKGETVVMTVQAGFEKGTGEPLFEQQEIDLAPMPYIVVIVDEMADLMMVAGKEIEGAIQRLAQMARAAGIHLIMATQRPSVDVITGTIKANFPTRISFQVTSKIDSRTILGEQGAEQLLGQGDMLHMMGGGRIARVHGPFVSDAEVEHVVAHLKAQGRPEYLETVTADEDEEEEEGDQGPVFDKGAVAAEDGDPSYDEAVKVVLRDKKCSTSYIQRRLGIGYNRAASLVERMEKEGLVGAPNHVGKREIMAGKRPSPIAPPDDGTD